VHELSIALSLVDVACEKAEALGNVRVEAVAVRVGPLAGIVPAALSFCFDAATRGTAIEGARLEIEEVSVIVRCPRCVEERQLTSVQHLRCPTCGEWTPDIVHGRELELTALEVVDR
jgi:hydrogenase nickel incorporation protein HypA/HybF